MTTPSPAHQAVEAADHIVILIPGCEHIVKVIQLSRTGSESPMSVDDQIILAQHKELETLRAELARPLEVAAPVIKYVPVSGKLRTEHWGHPNDDEPRGPELKEALRLRGDDKGQGLDGYWKWGFCAGFNAAASRVPVAAGAEPMTDEQIYHQARGEYEIAQIRRTKGTRECWPKFCALTPIQQAGWVARACATPVPGGAGGSDQGYADAFYKIGELLGIPAVPDSPAVVFERVMLPKIKALIATQPILPQDAKGAGSDSAHLDSGAGGNVHAPGPTGPRWQVGIWTLTAPDGRTWQADSPLKACSAEQRDRIPPEVALARIYETLDESEELPLMGKAFRTTQTDGSAGKYHMVFAFRDLPALYAADDEWRKFRGAA